MRDLASCEVAVPAAHIFSRHLEADLTVFDAMDELSKFRFAPERWWTH